ncbi:PorP/SprF family type IX secretion system membrane protein [Sediminibacterium salmoneum]|uniref:PorP/SprF family type IX secretion system membrane protein n=1 Tax=Sediminibacterium salmoneum TaxID=426421 RepID=UPI0004AF1D32|nr:PorP/SprF family type IX secretion system membrane protein [Sediminibacterium salmoneum]
MKWLAGFCLATFCNTALWAQDPQFSQFFSSPLTLNPALTGNFNGTTRMVGNFRSQNADYNNAYNTKTASVDFNVLSNKIKPFDRLSLGVLFLSDQTGNKVLTNNHLGLSLAYMKALDEEQKRSVSIGFQAVYNNKRFNAANALLEDQITTGGIINSSGDNILTNGLSKTAIDVNAGILYQYAPTSEHLYYIGGSLFNILQTQKGFGNNTSAVPLRKSIHGGLMSPVGFAGTFHASFHFQQQKGFNQLLIGGAYSHYIKDALRSYVEVYLGAWYRTDQSIIPYIGFEWNYWRLGYTNDISFSNQLTAGQLRYSNEVSLHYTLNKDKGLLKYKCGVF